MFMMCCGFKALGLVSSCPLEETTPVRYVYVPSHLVQLPASKLRMAAELERPQIERGSCALGTVPPHVPNPQLTSQQQKSNGVTTWSIRLY